MDNNVVQTNFSKWGEALLANKPAMVAALYAEHASLLPTMAKRVITDRAGVEEYFKFFLSFAPRVSMVEEHSVQISDHSYLHCGVYRFALTVDGKTEEVDARFSMLWEQINNVWQLLHHHSSRIPMV